MYIYIHIHGVPCYFLSSRLLQPLPPEKPMRVATPKSERRESPSALHPFAATVARLASFPSSGFSPEAVIRLTTKSTCVHLWGAKAWKRAHVVTGVDFVCETPTGTLSLCSFFHPPHPLLPEEPADLLSLPRKCPKEPSVPLLNERSLAPCAFLETGSVLLGSDFSVGGQDRGVRAALDPLFHRLISQLSSQILI